jgi:hypothetical protein
VSFFTPKKRGGGVVVDNFGLRIGVEGGKDYSMPIRDGAARVKI